MLLFRVWRSWILTLSTTYSKIILTTSLLPSCYQIQAHSKISEMLKRNVIYKNKNTEYICRPSYIRYTTNALLVLTISQSFQQISFQPQKPRNKSVMFYPTLIAFSHSLQSSQKCQSWPETGENGAIARGTRTTKIIICYNTERI